MTRINPIGSISEVVGIKSTGLTRTARVPSIELRTTEPDGSAIAATDRVVLITDAAGGTWNSTRTGTGGQSEAIAWNATFAQVQLALRTFTGNFESVFNAKPLNANQKGWRIVFESTDEAGRFGITSSIT